MVRFAVLKVLSWRRATATLSVASPVLKNSIIAPRDRDVGGYSRHVEFVTFDKGKLD